eukprot:symbB.v1.2.016750.t1/scaffold1284.1/size126905/4
MRFVLPPWAMQTAGLLGGRKKKNQKGRAAFFWGGFATSRCILQHFAMGYRVAADELVGSDVQTSAGPVCGMRS